MTLQQGDTDTDTDTSQVFLSMDCSGAIFSLLALGKCILAT